VPAFVVSAVGMGLFFAHRQRRPLGSAARGRGDAPGCALAQACPWGSCGAKDGSLRGAAARLGHVLDSLGVDHDVRE
jgi:hypothetical protein